MEEVPVGCAGKQCVVEPVDVARRVMREDHLVGPSSLAKLGNCLYSIRCRAVGVDPESVHAERRSGSQENLQILEICRVSTVADHDPREIDSFGFEDLLLIESPFLSSVGMRRDEKSGFAVDLRHRPKNALDAGSETLLVGGAL